MTFDTAKQRAIASARKTGKMRLSSGLVMT